MESVATVTTSRAARYGKQLAAHMGRTGYPLPGTASREA